MPCAADSTGNVVFDVVIALTMLLAAVAFTGYMGSWAVTFNARSTYSVRPLPRCFALGSPVACRGVRP